jgi:hypothetical protein
MIETATTVRGPRLVGERVSEKALLPPKGCPLGSNQPVYLVRLGIEGPVDGAMLEVIVTPMAVGRTGLIGNRIAQKPGFTSELCPFLPNASVHYVGASFGRPINDAMLIVAVASAPVRQTLFRSGGLTKKPSCPA